MNFNLESEESIVFSIKQLAQTFILHKALKINDALFSFIDVEFYFWHKNHQDEFANSVPHNRQFGDLEAHRYGIDVSLGNDINTGIGGMLICSLYDTSNMAVIEKSKIRCAILNSLNIGRNTIDIVDCSNDFKDVFQSKRMNLGSPNSPNKIRYAEAHYKFIVKDANIFRRYKNKEVIIKNSNLTEEDSLKLLNYKLSK